MYRIFFGLAEDRPGRLNLDSLKLLKTGRRNFIKSRSKELLAYLDSQSIEYILIDNFLELGNFKLDEDINYFTDLKTLEEGTLEELEGFEICFLETFDFSPRIDASLVSGKDIDLGKDLLIKAVDSVEEWENLKKLIETLYGEGYKVYFLKQEGIGSIEVLRLIDRPTDLNEAWPFDIFLRGRKAYNLNQILGIMEDLRSEEGCPWDRLQTHESLKPYLIEEAYELVDAIEKKDDQLLLEELGDLLLQVIFHSQLAREGGRFGFQNVVNALGKKLIYRHPHVFSQKGIEKEDEIIYNWDKLKYRAKDIDTLTARLEDVSKSSALLRSCKIQARMAKVGFDWPDISGPFEKIAEEKSEVRQLVEMDLMDYDRIEEEVGDLFFSVVNLSRFLKVDPDIALQKASDKFISRVGKMEAIGLDQGLDLSRLSIDDWELLWQKAKLSEK